MRNGMRVRLSYGAMSQHRLQAARALLALLALAASAVAATTAQSAADTWWTGYGNGPDNSRYFPSKQITRRNVGRLQVAWTYTNAWRG